MNTTPENLTKEEKESLINFIGRAVLENCKFPSNTVGVNNVTIQELVSDRTISSLENYGDFIEKRVNQQGSTFKSKKGPVKFGSVLGTDLINNLHLIIKLKDFEEYKENTKSKVKELKKLIEDSKSPEQRVADAKLELAKLEALELA